MPGRPRNPGNAGSARPAPTLTEQARAALGGVTHRISGVRVSIPKVGEVRLPPLQDLVFLTTVGALTGFGLIEWPVALVVILGRILATKAPSPSARAAGEGLQQA